MNALRRVLRYGSILAIFVLMPGPVRAAGPALLLNEIVASNSHGIKDPQGHYEDWIELSHAGTTTVNTAGL